MCHLSTRGTRGLQQVRTLEQELEINGTSTDKILRMWSHVSFKHKRGTRTAASAHTGRELEMKGTSIDTIL